MVDYLTVSEAAEITGMDRSALIRAEERGELGEVSRTGGGHRRYTRQQLDGLAPVVSGNGSGPAAKPRLNYRELGTTGLTRYGGQIWEEKLRELRGREGRLMFREMRMNSPVVAAIFLGIVSALKEPSRRIIPASDRPADRKAGEHIDSCFEDMSFSWKDTLDLVLNPLLEQGFAVPELVYKLRLGPNPPPYLPEHFSSKGDRPAPSRFSDGFIGWRKWAPRPAESLAEGQEWIFDGHGGVRGINQAPDVIGGQTRPLVERNVDLEDEDAPPSIYSVPIEKLLHFRTTLHPANNPEGMSILRPSYLPYYYANNMMEVEGIGAERDLAGVPVIYLGEGTTLGEDPDSDWSMGKQIVTSLRADEQAGVVFPHQKLDSQGRGVLLELLSTGGRRAWDVGSIVERYEKRITLSVLAQFLMLGMEQVGSFALSRHQGDLFVLVVQALMDMVADIINRHGIPRLMAVNAFPGVTGDPRLAFSPVGIPKLEELAEFVNRLAERELLTPDPELERHLRQVAGLPQPAVRVEGPAAETEQTRDAEKTALLLRRISLAVEPLEGLGALDPGEGAALLSPLVDELRAALGNPQATGSDFEQRLAGAKRRLSDRVEAGVPVTEIAKGYVADLLKKKIAGLELVDELERRLAEAWDEMVSTIEGGEAPAVALSAYEAEAAALLEQFYREAFRAGSEAEGEDPDRDDGGLVAQAVTDTVNLLSAFVLALGSQLGDLDRAGMADLLGRRRSRSLLASGGAWDVYVQSKILGAPPDSIWMWDASPPIIESSCSVCREEVGLGPRPLSQITRFPVRDSTCQTNCRHDLIRRRDLE